MSVNLPFSARNRGSHSFVDDDFPRGARAALLHIVADLIGRRYVSGWRAVRAELARLARVRPSDYHPDPVEDVLRSDTEELLLALPWERVYDFCERLHGHLAQEVGFVDNWEQYVSVPRSEVQAFISAEIQNLFLEEGLAFEFEDGVVQRRGRRHTAQQVSRAQVVLGDPRLEGARKHYTKALRFFRESSNPDYENAIKEAVCAVEATGKALFPDAKAKTMGELVKWLQGKGLLPKALGQTMEGLYAFRSGGAGVAHGGASGGAATAANAEYVLGTAASQIILLVDLAKEMEPEIPF